MTRLAPTLSLPAMLLLAACATADAPRSLSSATAGAGTDSVLRATCTAEAERAVNFRERGQSARDDQAMFMTDQTNNIPTLRVQADQFNRRVLREDLIRECIRANTAGPQPQDPAAPAARGRRS
ncbi:hypothetical protein [Roseomonas fluvialis]|uniref:Lipoprotein n=1 Tax=Roseomonas fluvialis TaxID=1750527 RepID=A0ABM7Y3T9_9PROT|nr:hypothetical protein [Roseomonas fluvialis]BDG72506.1 hypothetical protein Rmf_24350 [Roseomonas fluvialis]